MMVSDTVKWGWSSCLGESRRVGADPAPAMLTFT